MKPKSKSPKRPTPARSSAKTLRPFFSKTPWAGFAREQVLRDAALPVCADPRCRRTKLCIAAHENLFCQRTHFSGGEKQKRGVAAQQAFEKKFPAYPTGTPWELREKRVQAIMAHRKSEQDEMQARWKAGAFDHLYGTWRRGGVLMKPPPKDYVDLR